MADSKAMVKPDSNQLEVKVEDLSSALINLPIYMRSFSLVMRSLYAENAVGSTNEAAKDFRKLRDATRNDAMVYLKQILPVSKEVISSLQMFFEYYQELEMNEWYENLADIVSDARGYRQLCDVCVKMHESILTPLKKREDEARVVMKEMKELEQEYERKKAKYEAEARHKHSWAFGLSFLPIINVIASPILNAEANSDLAKAAAEEAQAKTQEAAALLIQETMIPAIKNFIDGLHCAAGFFQIIENELDQFAKTGDKAISRGHPVHLHFIMMKKKANKISTGCEKFMFVIPAVQTDFEAIPVQGTDQNYIDRWLEKQKKLIKESCRVESNVKKMLKILVDAAKK